jgi:hypothetical protein
MFMNEYPIDEIVHVHQLVWKELTPLFPTLIFLHQDDVEIALKRLYTFRSEKWMAWTLQTTSQYQWFQSRGSKDFDGWVQFFKEWQGVAEHLYSDWPFRKTKIKNPHGDWEQAYRKMYRFLQLNNIRE